MSVNRFFEVVDINYLYLAELSQLAMDLNQRFTVTTNYENIQQFGGEIYKNCQLVSLSFDEFKINNLKFAPFVEAVCSLKKYVKQVNLNILLTKRLIAELKNGLLEKLLRHADSCYLLLPKCYPTDFSRQDFYDFLKWFLLFIQNFTIFSKVHLDKCIRPYIFPFSEVYSNCQDCFQSVTIGPGGEIGYCTYEFPYAVLEKPVNFLKILRQMVDVKSAGAMDRYEACTHPRDHPFCRHISFNPIQNE
ncbi:hypothetical protein JXA70_05330 [candidate division KSB1 bacterium]|nr:hypothetical protein [candidate division KSB1 bacterium]